MIVIVDLRIFGYDCCPLHYTDRFIIAPTVHSFNCGSMTMEYEHSLMSNLKFCPFTPNLSKIINVLEVDFRRFLQNLPRIVEVCFSFASGTTLFVELREVDVKSV